MSGPRLPVLLLILAAGAVGATPLQAQAPHGAWLETAGLLTHHPRWTDEPETRVRIGMGGRDVGYTVELGARVKGPLGLAFTMHATPTRQFWWRGAGATAAYGWKPAGEAAASISSTPLTWNCTTLSAVLQYRGRVSVSGGGGLCGMSGIEYRLWGAGPMYSEAAHVTGRGYQPLAPGLDAAFRCDVYRVNFASPRFTVVKIWAGEAAGGYTERDFSPISCGVGMRWKPGSVAQGAVPAGFVAEAGSSAFLRTSRGSARATFAPTIALGTRIPLGANALSIRIRAAGARLSERERTAPGHDAGFHQMTITGEYSPRPVAGPLRASAQLGAWTAGARDWQVWRRGLSAGALLGAGLELPVLGSDAGNVGLACSAQLLLGGAPAPLVVPCGVRGALAIR